MSTSLITVKTQARKGRSRSVSIPVAIPDLKDVRALAERLHKIGKSYQDRVWGWKLTYEPEAEVDVPDGKGGFVTQMMPLRAPAKLIPR
jgi:hypothetical protein